MTLDEKLKCVNLEIAESQRENELLAGLGYEGTKGFDVMGCYDCKGYNFDCPAYMNLEDLD